MSPSRSTRLRFTLRQLEYLVAVGEAGSIAEAANQLNVSSPSISAAISQLEQVFGVQLFVRKPAHGLSLSSAGRRFLNEAGQVLDAAHGLNGLADDISGAVAGPFSVGCLLTFAQLVLPEIRQRFELKYPQVRIRQTEGHQGQLLDLLRRGELDVALTYDLEIGQDLVFMPFAELPPYVLLPASHRLAGEPELSVQDLDGEPMILLDLPYSGEYMLSILRDNGVVPRIAEKTRDMAVLHSMVANGYGFALANIRPRSDTSPDGKPLRFVPLTGGLRPMNLGLVRVRTELTTRVMKAFTEHCSEQISSASIPGLMPGEG